MDTLKKRINGKQGFTLVELLVVIAIIAILSVTAFISLGGETVKARDAKRQQDLATIQNAMEIFFINETGYPATLTTSDIDKKYLSQIPEDPRSDAGSLPYHYEVSGSTYLVVATLENDGAPANYEAYLVGNGDLSLLTGDGVVGANCGGSPASCDIDPDGNPNCVPYCP